jgi:hypothetical protein
MRTESKTWQSASLFTLQDVFYYSSLNIDKIESADFALRNLENIFSKLSALVKENNFTQLNIDNENIFLLTSMNAIKMLNELLDNELLDNERFTFLKTEIYNLLVIKQFNYGPKNIIEFGILGIIVRMYDKVARLVNLITKANSLKDALTISTIKDESIVDTLFDIVGYCTMALMIESKDPEFGNWFLFQFEDHGYASLH